MTTEKPTCFVIMPISDPSNYNAGHFAIVYDHLIKPACAAAGFKPIRADDINETNYIALDVLRQILDAEMTLCDISSRNPNVLYELGLRHAVRKPVTIIKDSKTDEIFDIQGIRRLEYDGDLRIDKIKEIVTDLTDTLKSTYEKRDDSGNSLMQLVEHRSKDKEPKKLLSSSALVRPIAGTHADVAPIHGEVGHWDEVRRIGAIHGDDGQDYYVNPSFTAHNEKLSVGEEVFFLPMGNQEDGKNPFATCVLAVGRQVDGIILYVNNPRNFAFAEVSDPRGHKKRVYISGGSEPMVEGTPITFRVSQNPEGVSGLDPIPRV